MAKKNELAVIAANDLQVVPTAEDLSAIMTELSDMGTLPFGRIQIAGAGANVFKVTEPGEDEAVVATEITAVIIAHHPTNVLWLHKFGTVDDKTPDCVSPDGKEGIDRATGEEHRCDQCAYNQFGSADGGQGRGKACKNSRRLYLMRLPDGNRPGDVLPLMLTLPSTALHTFDQYRVQLVYGRLASHGVVTNITLKSAKSKDGVDYSTPVFKAVGALPADEAARVKEYADGFLSVMKHVQVYDEQGDRPAPSYAPAPPAAASFAPPADDDDDELPFG